MGCTAAIVFTCLGASYGTAKSGVGIAAMGVLRPDLIVKSALITKEEQLGSRLLTETL
jgi:V-type H+-transporting ATPase proteolipid subunit